MDKSQPQHNVQKLRDIKSQKKECDSCGNISCEYVIINDPDYKKFCSCIVNFQAVQDKVKVTDVIDQKVNEMI